MEPATFLPTHTNIHGSVEEINNLIEEAKGDTGTPNGTGEDVAMQDLSDLSDISEG